MRSSGLLLKSRSYIGIAEPPAAVLEDISGRGSDGTFLGSGQPDWVKNEFGIWVLDFDGTDDEIALGTAPLSVVTAGTIMFWAKPETFTADPANWQGVGVFCKGAIYANVIFCSVSSVNKIRYGYNDGATTQQFDCASALVASQWYHFAYAWDTNGTNLVIDGSLDITDAKTFTDMAAAGKVEEFVIGTNRATGTASEIHFDGQMGSNFTHLSYKKSVDQIRRIFDAERHWFGV